MPGDELQQVATEGNAGAAQPAAAATAPVAPAGEPVQQVPETTPVQTTLEEALGTASPAAPPVSAPVGVIDPKETVDFNGPDGLPTHATLGQLVDHWVKNPKIDANRLQLLDTFERAVAGDASALQKLTESQAAVPAGQQPGQAPPGSPPAVGTQEYEQLQQQFNQLQQTVAAQTPMFAQIENAQRISTVRGLLEKCSGDLPYSFKHPTGAQKVLDRIRGIEQIAAANNINLQTHPNRQAILAEAFKDVERELEESARVFQGWAPSAAEAANNQTPAGTEVIDDQRTAAPGHWPADLQMVDGQLVNKRGQPVMPNGNPAPLPAQPPEMTGTGAPVGVQPDVNQGPMTIDRLKQDLKARARVIAQGAGL